MGLERGCPAKQLRSKPKASALLGKGRGIVKFSSLSAIALRSPPCYNACMNTALKITRIGNSAGIVLPKELLAHLGARVGETLSVVTTPHGIELSAAEPDFEAQMAAAREVMARRKRALSELAK